MFNEYVTRTQKPENFDQFYSELIQGAKYSNVEIYENKEFKVEGVSVNNLFFTTDDGSKIHVKYTFPTAQNVKKVILLFHGYYGNSGAWFDKISYSKLGYAVMAIDVRGQSGLSTDVCNTSGSTLKGMVIKGAKEGPGNLYYTQVYLDTYRLTCLAKELYPDIPLVAMGGSQGGALAAVCSALTPTIKQCIIHYPYLSDIEHSYEVGLPYDGIENYFKLEDPLAKTYKQFFETLRYIDIQFFAEKIDAAVTMFVGKKDIVCPLECQSAFYNKLKCEKKVYFYPEKGHEYLDGSEDIILNLLLDNFQGDD